MTINTKALKATNNESGTNTQLITSAEVATIHVAPVPAEAPGVLVMVPGTTSEESIYFREKDDALGTVSGLVRDLENQNGGVGREHQANSAWETLQSTRYLNNVIDVLQEGFQEEMNEVTYVSATSFTVKTNRTAFYTLGRVLRVDGSTIAVVNVDPTYSAGTGLTTVVVTGIITNPLTKIELDLQTKGHTLATDSTSLYRQAIINGNFDIWQRGTSFTAMTGNVLYCADRWKMYSASAGNTYSRQDGTGVPGSVYCLRCQRNNATSATDINYLLNLTETENAVKFRGKKLTLTFWARKGANFSSAGSIINAQIYTGTGTDEGMIAAYTGKASAIGQNNVLTADWQKFTLTTTDVLANTVTEFCVQIINTPVGTAEAADYFEIAQVQLCAGDVALPFMPKSYNEELRLCQRYCYAPSSGSVYGWIGYGIAFATNSALIAIALPATMRTGLPTLTATAGDWQVGDVANASIDVTAIGINSNFGTNTSNAVIAITVASGLTIGRSYIMHGDNAAVRTLILSAEI